MSNETVSENLKCDDCDEYTGDVEETTCPYAEDMKGNIVKCVLCRECRQLRADDI